MTESVDANRTKSFARQSPIGRWELAAAALVLISVGDYFYHRERLAAIAAEHLRLIVTGPSSLLSGVAAECIVSTDHDRRRAAAGRDRGRRSSAPDGARLKAYKETADQYGRLQVRYPRRLEAPSANAVEGRGAARKEPGRGRNLVGGSAARLQHAIGVGSAAVSAGRDRLLSLADAFSLRPGGGRRNARSILRSAIPSGGVAPDSPQDRLTERGVGSGDFNIPEEAAEGRYTLVARSADKAFPEEKTILRRPSRSAAVEEGVAGRGRGMADRRLPAGLRLGATSC